MRSYGLSVTTMEEVFLNVSQAAQAATAQAARHTPTANGVNGDAGDAVKEANVRASCHAGYARHLGNTLSSGAVVTLSFLQGLVPAIGRSCLGPCPCSTHADGPLQCWCRTLQSMSRPVLRTRFSTVPMPATGPTSRAGPCQVATCVPSHSAGLLPVNYASSLRTDFLLLSVDLALPAAWAHLKFCTAQLLPEQHVAPTFIWACAGPPVRGWALTRQRLWALLVKRSCCARRDRLAVVTQLAVPILLVLVALWAGKAYVNSPDEPPLVIDRCDQHALQLYQPSRACWVNHGPLASTAAACRSQTLKHHVLGHHAPLGRCMHVPDSILAIVHTRRATTFLDFPAAIGATPEVRAQNDSFAAFWDAYNVPHASRFRHPAVATAFDSNQTKLFSGGYLFPHTLQQNQRLLTSACYLCSATTQNPTSRICVNAQGHSLRRQQAHSRGTCWTGGSGATTRTTRCSWGSCQQRRCANIQCGSLRLDTGSRTLRPRCILRHPVDKRPLRLKRHIKRSDCLALETSSRVANEVDL